MKQNLPNSADERLTELAQILASGVRRILAAQSSSLSAPTRESCVDILALKSGVRRRKRRN